MENVPTSTQHHNTEASKVKLHMKNTAICSLLLNPSRLNTSCAWVHTHTHTYRMYANAVCLDEVSTCDSGLGLWFWETWWDQSTCAFSLILLILCVCTHVVFWVMFWLILCCKPVQTDYFVHYFGQSDGAAARQEQSFRLRSSPVFSSLSRFSSLLAAAKFIFGQFVSFFFSCCKFST